MDTVLFLTIGEEVQSWVQLSLSVDLSVNRTALIFQYYLYCLRHCRSQG
jgi:hypothetical protein